MKFYDDDGRVVEEPCLWEYAEMSIIGIYSCQVSWLLSGPKRNLEKLNRGDFGCDGTFCLSNVRRKIDDQEKHFTQAVQLVRKVETVVTRLDGSETKKVAIEPLFVILMTSKKKELYIEMWQNFRNLHLEYYPDKERLEPGQFRHFIVYWASTVLTELLFSLRQCWLWSCFVWKFKRSLAQCQSTTV